MSLLDRFDRLKKLERENRILELQVKNARLRKELEEIERKAATHDSEV